jgi:hypothetical protein
MSKLPIGELKWLEKEEYEHIDWMVINTNKKVGYMLEVDLEYPSELHELHNDFPLAPESIELTFKNLSPYAKKSLLECGGSKKFKDIKLSATFHTRKNYILHFKNLKLYLSLGMKLKNIHRVLSFKQKKFIAPFIQKCTEERQKAKTKFEQDQFKKVANSTYGKTIQNVRNYLHVKLHFKQKSLLKAISNHTYKNYVILDENFVQTNHFTPFVIHDRPIFIGFAILELSKHFMYDFYYNKLLNESPSNIDLGFSDTDSFLFKVNNAKEFIPHIQNHMDFSNYDRSNPLFNNEHKAELGYFKDELKGTQICTEFVGLRAKCYALKLKDAQMILEKKVCKGLGRIAITNRLKFKHYKKCLYKRKLKRFHFHSIRSTKQNVSTVLINKKAISHFDSKRWLFNCGIHSSPYGSILIKQNFSKCPKKCTKLK